MHRLDRDTSGVLVLARTPGVAAKLAAAFRGRDVEKTYWAVVAGRPVPVEGRIDLPLRRVGGERGERTAPAARDDKDAARAITDYRTLDHAAQKLAWLELQPLDRPHPPASGPLRGARRADPRRREIRTSPTRTARAAPSWKDCRRMLHLHARALRLPHPAGGTVSVEADLPPHMRETFQTLGFQAPRAGRPQRR